MPIDTTETLYPTKSLRFQICDFFCKLRRNKAGISTPLRVNLHDMEELLQYHVIDDGNDDKIIALGRELVSLNNERFGDAMDRPVISITNLPSPEDFLRAYSRDEVLDVRCSTENIEAYMSKLKERTRVAEQIRQYGDGVRLDRLSNGRVAIVLGDKKMKVNKTKKHKIDVLVIIVQLMYGESVDPPGVSIDSYERGYNVSYDDLLRYLHRIEGNEDENDQSNIDSDTVKDAVSYLDKRSMKIFSCSLFRTNNDSLSWVL